jgi:pSer/pThr/pTyr-binding forkhead associated (FHA) protein
MRKLVVTENGRARELLCIGTMAVGRDPHCDISASDPLLSRHHAEFVASPDSVVVRDLQSRNGITVNGTKVEQAVLRPGDRVVIAGLLIELVEESTAEIPADDEPFADADRALPPRRVAEEDIALWPEELVADRVEPKPQVRTEVPRPLAPTRMAIEVAPPLAPSDQPGPAAGSALPAAASGQSSLRIRAVSDTPLPPSARAAADDAPLTAGWSQRVRIIVVMFAVIVYAVTALPLALQHPREHVVELLFAGAFTIVAGLIAALFVERVTVAALTGEGRGEQSWTSRGDGMSSPGGADASSNRASVERSGIKEGWGGRGSAGSNSTGGSR